MLMEGVPEVAGGRVPSALHATDAATDSSQPLPLHVFVPMKAPSINRTWQVLFHKRTVEKRTDVLLFEAKFKTYLPAWTPQPNTKYVLLVTFYEEWVYAKTRQIKRKDVHNLVKVIQDAVCKRYGLDDAWVWITVCCKAQVQGIEGMEVFMDATTPELLDGLSGFFKAREEGP